MNDEKQHLCHDCGKPAATGCTHKGPTGLIYRCEDCWANTEAALSIMRKTFYKNPALVDKLLPFLQETLRQQNLRRLPN